MGCVDSPKVSYLCPNSQYLSMYSETGPLKSNGVKTRLLLDVSIQSSSSPYNKGIHREAHLECVAHTQRHTWGVWPVNRQQGGEPSASQGERSHRELIQPVIHLRLPASRTVRKVWTSYPACGVCYSGPSKHNGPLVYLCTHICIPHG